MKNDKTSLRFYSISFVVRADLRRPQTFCDNRRQRLRKYRHVPYQTFWNLAQLEKLFLKINIFDSIQTPLLYVFKFASFLSTYEDSRTQGVMTFQCVSAFRARFPPHSRSGKEHGLLSRTTAANRGYSWSWRFHPRLVFIGDGVGVQ